MERMKGKQASLIMWAIVAALLTQNLVIAVMSAAPFGDQKNYFFFPPIPDPRVGGTPPGSPAIGTSPPTGSTPSTPSPGSGGSHGSTPSHGGTPPANYGNPPSRGHHNPSPSPPKSGRGGVCRPTPSRPSTPSTPRTPSNPSTPRTPNIPTTPRTPSYPGTPDTPSTPTTPSTPGISVPSPPFDPHSPFTGTCNFWRNHPGLVWGTFGWWGTIGRAFGVTSLPGFGANMNLLQALSNSHRDGLGALYREGTASLLNSMVNKGFPYSTRQVRNSFVAALSSNKAAAAQAKIFKQANEGRLKPRT